MQVEVSLQPKYACLMVHGLQVMGGELYQAIKAEDSIWTVQERIVRMCLLKRNRKGCYANGCTAADTFWRAIFKRHSSEDSIQLKHPPSRYYNLEPSDQDTALLLAS